MHSFLVSSLRPKSFRVPPAIRQLHITVTLAQEALLSKQFALSKEWDSRHEVLKRELGISGDYEWITAVQKKFHGGGNGSAIDVDIAATLAREFDQVADMLALIYKLRHTTNTADLQPSTEYAMFRLFLDHNDIDNVLKVVNDPINYGIFMNEHVTCLFIDYLLQADNVQGAAKLATVAMQQEMFDNNLLNFVSVYALLNWAELPLDQRIFDQKVQPVQPIDEDTSDEDMTIFRFPYLKNVFNDGHLDLVEAPLLVGKSLEWFTRYLELPETPGSDAQKNKSLLRDITFLGQVFQSKFAEAKQSLEESDMLMPMTAKIAREHLEGLKAAKGEKKGDGTSAEEGEATEALDRLLEKLPPVEESADGESLAKTLHKLFKPVLADEEQKLMGIQKQLFAQWNTRRKELVEIQAERVEMTLRLEDIDKRKAELLHEKEVLYFFENRLRWEDQAQQKDRLWEELDLNVKAGALTEEEYARDMFEQIQRIRQGKVRVPSNTQPRNPQA